MTTAMPSKFLYFLFLTFFATLLSAAELTDLSVNQVQAMQQQGEALVIDIRTAQEWQNSGIIPDSHKLQFFNSDGKYDADTWLAKLAELKSSPDQPVILVCRSGNRSGMVGNFLTQKLGMKNIYHLSNGIRGWQKAGQQLEKTD